MEVTGECYLPSVYARKLFALTKVWIVEFWEREGRLVNKIEIKKKIIGRNPGFIVCASLTGPDDVVSYYAKIQDMEIDTVMMHYLLKYTNCGPEDFLITVLSLGNDYPYNLFGIVTREVPNLKTASCWSLKDVALLKEQPLSLQCFTFMLTFLVKFGRFGNIPRNVDNWGFSLDVESDVASLKLVDFSSYGHDYSTHEISFYDTMFDIRGKVAASCNGSAPSDGQLRSVLECPQFWWLQSRDALVELMRKVVDSTDEWILQNCTSSCTDSHSTTSTTSSDMRVHDDSLLETCVSQGQYTNTTKGLWYQYDMWLCRWNRQLQQFIAWFPFPSKPARKERVIAPTPRPKAVSANKHVCHKKSTRYDKWDWCKKGRRAQGHEMVLRNATRKRGLWSL